MSYVLYGPQGSGKTTIAERLRARLKAKRVIEEDSEEFPRGGVWRAMNNPKRAAQIKAANVLYVTCEGPPPNEPEPRCAIHITTAKSMLGVA